MQRFVVVIVGIIFLAVGAFMFFRNDSLVKNCTVEAKAIVVDLKEDFSTDSDSGASYIYYPIIEYQVGEKTVRVVMDNGSSTPKYNINEKITILYNPDKPKQFIVKGDKSSSIFSIVFLALGVFVTGYGIVLAFKKN